MSSKVATWRGCASNFAQPLSPDDEQEAQSLVDTVYRVNCKEEKLNTIVYRTGDAEKDILHQVFRWEVAPYEHVFENGLQSHHRRRINKNKFYNLYSYAQGGSGRLLDSREPSEFAFISTTISNSWYPHVRADSKTVQVFRYEIYAPGGIWTSLTLADKDDNGFKRFDEVAFVAGIAPQYIRSAQLFILTGTTDGTTTIKKADNVLVINGNFNPQSHPLRLLNIQNPVSDYTEDDSTKPLTHNVYQPSSNMTTTTTTNIIDWYAHNVANLDIYLSAALPSSRLNEAYYVLQNWSTLLYYDPGGSDDYIVDGPSLNSNMFKSLKYTPFGEHGIDGAFQSHRDEAFIFCANLVALLDYAPGTKNNDTIVKGPMTIAEMFPFLKGTVFENGIDSAFEVKSAEYEAYLFKGNLCAHINFGPSARLIAQGQICNFFPHLKGSIFESLGVDAAYASHSENDLGYFFKHYIYGKIYVAGDNGSDYSLGVWFMGANAPVIHSFVPKKNRGLDMRDDPATL